MRTGRLALLGRLVAALALILTTACAGTTGPHSVYREIDRARAKQDRITKLSSDINKVDHSIEVTKDLIKRSPDATYLAELYFRLAELYVERSRYVYARIIEQQPEGDTSLAGDKALEVQISKKLAIETYTKIITEYPDYQHNDQVRFFRAHEYRELGEWETMLKEYEELVAKYPKSDWAIEARLILGDHYFDKGDFVQSEARYNEVLALPESHMHDMARYKLGWIRINQEKYADALKLFEAAVTSGRKSKKGAIGDAHKLNVKREALMAIPWPFSEVRKAHQAPAYFIELADSKTQYLEALKRLANRYFVKTDYTAAALLYREVARLSSDVETNIEFVQRIYDSVRNMSAKDPRRYANAAGDVEAIVETVARFENHWKFGDEEKGQLKKDFELRARDLATRLHMEAKNKGDEKAALIAALAYRRYLSLFDDAKERQEIEINRAEALNQGKKYVDAGEQYEAVARSLPQNQEQRDLLYSAILAFHQALDADAEDREKRPAAGGLLDAWELLRAREGLKQMGAYYVKTWPQSENAANVKFNIAKMFYQQGEYEKSSELFAAFIEEYPTHKDVGIAGNLALDALHKLDKYDELAKLAQAFVSNAKITNQKFKNEAAQIGESAKRRKIEYTLLASSDAGDFSDRMVSEWEKHKGEKEGEDFLYAAFLKLMSEGNVAGVFDFGGRLIGAYPDSKRIGEVIGTMGTFAVRAADFERAAALFEELHKRNPAGAEGLKVLANAAEIRFLLGQANKAAEDYRALLAGGNPAQAGVARERLMQIYRDAQSWAELATLAREGLERDPQSVAANYHLGLALAEQGQDGDAAAPLEAAANSRPRSDFDKNSQVRALFALGRLLQKRFDSLQFSEGANTEEVVGSKVQLLGAIEGLYVRAIQSGDGEWGIASLQELARLYDGFGAFVASAPGTAAEKPQYEAAAQQQRAKAKEILGACKQKAEELKVFTAHAAACLAGSFGAVVVEAKRYRGATVGDEVYQGDIAAIRNDLARTPESPDLLKKLARRAMQVGDYHLARLVLEKIVERKPQDGEAQNLLGAAYWSLGEMQEAYAAFDKAHTERAPAASANLAALFSEYGYAQLAQQYLGQAGTLKPADLTSPDYHPSVAKLAQENSAP